jgi:iron complex outermembrane recepter protein
MGIPRTVPQAPRWGISNIMTINTAGGRALVLTLLMSSVATPALAQAGPTAPVSTESTSTGVPATAPGDAAVATTDPVPASDAALSDAGPRDSAPPTPAATSGQLNEIVVTATKRETNLQKTPIAISVLTTQALDDRHVNSLADLADGSVPGLRVATFEARQSALTIGIRGIVPLDANQPAREQGVGVYVDGVYLGRQQGLGAALLDVDRIEVLKGPQGTLFGRNTEGGALSIITKAPTGKFGLRAVAGVGNYGSRNAEAHLDIPAIGPFSFKVDGAFAYQDATTKNPFPTTAGFPDSVGFNYFNRKGVQGKVRFKPTNSFTADLSVDVGKDKNSPFYSQLLNYNPGGFPVGPASGTLPAGSIRPLPPLVVVNGDTRMKTADIGVPQRPSVDKTAGGALNLKLAVSPALELRSISGYRQVSVDQWDNSGGAHRPPVFTPNGNFSRYSLSYLTQHQYSQEFQAVGRVLDSVDYVLGLYYFKERAEEEAATPNSLRYNADGTGFTVLDPCIGSGGFGSNRGCRSIDRGSRARSISKAAYGQLTITPPSIEALHLTVGGRYTRDDKTGELYLRANAPSRCPITVVGAPICSFRQKTTRFNPLGIVAYDVNRDVHVYAKFATGYRAGGASSRSVTYNQFGPEDVKSYEVGAKTELFDRRMRLNIAAYMMRRKGTQVDFSTIIPNGASNINSVETINAPGTTRIKGVEIDAIGRVNDQLTLSGAYTYTYTKVPNTIDPFRPAAGPVPVFIVFTPRNVVNGALDYEVPMAFGGGNSKLRFHIDGNYADGSQSFAEFATKTDSSFITNARIAFADLPVGPTNGKLTLALWSRNLLNETHVYRRDPTNRFPNPITGSTANIIGDYGNFNAPRTVGVEASIKL